MHSTLLRLISILCALPLCALAADTGFLNRTVTLEGLSYRFQVYVPADWTPQQTWPVVLFLHGYGESGDDGLLQTQVGIATAIRTRAADFKLIVVMPQCRKGKLWVDPDMQGQALAALEQSVAEFRGDPTRLYLTGLSMGGYGSWEMAIHHPGKFAALVPICGGVAPNKHLPDLHSSLLNDPKIADPYAEIAKRIGPVPVWIFHGDADESVPVKESRGMNQALVAAKANVRYTEYPGVGHNSWDKAYSESEFIPWLVAQKLPQK
jgi:predicted peptidase